MNFILKNSQISTEVLNHDHMGFVTIINELYEAFNRRSNRENFLNLLDEFETYAIAHFETEEKYYKIYDYSNIELKKIKNELLLEKMKECRNCFLSKKVDEKELLIFLFNWVVIHFKEHDIRFDNFLEENSLNILFTVDPENHLTMGH